MIYDQFRLVLYPCDRDVVFRIYLSAGYPICHRIHAWLQIIKWRASFKSLPSVTPFFMWLLTHEQNSSKSYWCLIWGFCKNNEFALCDIPSHLEAMLPFRVLTFVTPNLRDACKYITHTHDIACLQQSTRCMWCENINEEHFSFQMIYKLCYLLPRTTSQWLKINNTFKYLAFHIESIWCVCVMGIHTT